jgi:hypothetical protein
MHNNWENSSLGGITKNVTLVIVETYSNLKQRKAHLEKNLTSNFISKYYPSHVNFKISIGFFKFVITPIFSIFQSTIRSIP